MSEINLPLATTTWDDAEKKAAIDVINSGYVTMGPKVQEFEKKFADYFGSQYAVMVNSGSSANLLAISALCYIKQNALKAGDEVIVPSLSWSTTYYPVNQCGLKLVFVDINIDTLNIDMSEVKKAITEKTRAIFVPNILGNPAELLALQQLCKEYNLYLIEDNCESMGATVGGKCAGTFGILGTFSTYFSHHISTMEGGVVVTNNEELYHIMLSLRSHGWTRHLPEENCVVKKNSNSFYESFRFVLPGYNLRPMEAAAAIGLEQLKKLSKIVEGRRKNAKKFVEAFSNQNIKIQKEYGKSSWFGFSLIFADEKTRDDVAVLLQNQKVDTRPVIAGCILEHDVMKYLDYRVVGEHSNARTVHKSGLFIGNHDYDISNALEKILQLAV
ncbi:UDP-4-amino-4-deoxy-L-arabinose--oxoglutarate aminotransferase [Piscirickettsia salmonis]|uniref:DegT/DnrJ/EryC1/StrS family aminotransferase n=1 Tax=Piscirickettsia salmonis TaxID=1238 RepID=UPI0012BA5F91|nr:DegT/DnrJ/EryC1/StrS family aminotransferase [Piscirickettsia salmonis]QGP56140.1 UDP-4-amino-4-deoxy-L-arabinose--oxoglutarate aminotransferase [Piscirickettsia salmonis]QGP57992.1 UDP-4-amino-4-deoxy-L-arabinose--oxoglutarate aminotransferase [Piscirickettsia salmonis]QGP65709.1 UDP-4-amino-4-deoxy-L-arabinose--oxoglutarate aminotransferase [Piscirickettsia salmonis]